MTVTASANGSNWPLCEQPGHFDLGFVLNCAVTDVIVPSGVGELSLHHAGLWECDLSDNSLIWSGGVYDIFGLQRGTPITRQEALGFYSEESRAKMERLRAYAIEYMLGFTVDIDIRAAAIGEIRRVRLIGAPSRLPDGTLRLHGVKLAI